MPQGFRSGEVSRSRGRRMVAVRKASACFIAIFAAARGYEFYCMPMATSIPSRRTRACASFIRRAGLSGSLAGLLGQEAEVAEARCQQEPQQHEHPAECGHQAR